MTDEQYPRSADDDVDPEALAAVQRALGHLDALKPLDSDAPKPEAADAMGEEPMPEWVWARISAALAAEQDTPAAPLRPRRSRLSRWGGGLVAASVAVLAVGIAVTSFRGSSGDIVATDAPADDAVAEMMAEAPAADAEAFSIDGAGAAAPSARTLAGPRMMSFAGIPPIRKILGSTTDYTPDAMQGQVTTALEDAGVIPTEALPEPAATVEVPSDVPAEMVDHSILKSAEALRDCVTQLTESQNSTALLIDQSRFRGKDASIVVTPEYPANAPATPDLTLIEVFVVDPDCKITWSMRFRMAR